MREATFDNAPGIARVHVDTWRSTYASFLPASYLTAMSYEKSTKMYQSLFDRRQTGLKTFVAEAGETLGITGACTGGYNSQGYPNYQGELIGIYVLPAFQHRGIGNLLVRAVKEHLLKLGVHGMLVWVFADNPNLPFYTHLGGSLIEEKIADFAGKKLKELAFGWKDILDLRV